MITYDSWKATDTTSTGPEIDDRPLEPFRPKAWARRYARALGEEAYEDRKADSRFGEPPTVQWYLESHDFPPRVTAYMMESFLKSFTKKVVEENA